MTQTMQPPSSSARGDPLDLRLACGAGAAWLAAICLAGGSATQLVLAGCIAAVVAVLLLTIGRGWRPAAAIAAALFCVALVLIPLAGRMAHARASPLATLAKRGASVTAIVRLANDPRLLAAKGVAGTPRVAVETSSESVSYRRRAIAVDGAVLVLADAAPWRDLLPGQRVRVDGELRPALDQGDLSVTLFARAPPQLLGRPPWWQRAAARVRSALREAAACLPDQERGLLPGLVDGDTAGLDPVLAERFRLAGLTHLVAVSGTNCSLLVGAVLLVLRRTRVRPWLSAGVGVAVLLMFVVVARPSPSVLRAALMGAIALVSLATGRPRAAVPALAAAVLALLTWQPTLARSASFAMSVLATAALLVLAPGWARALRDRRVPVGIAEAVAVAAAAHVVTAPIIAAISGRVSLVAIPANVIAEPVIALVTVLGFAAAVIAPLWPGAGTALAWLAGWPCRWLVHDAEFFGGLHGATVAWPGGAQGGALLLATALVIAAACVRIGARRVLAAAGATALIIFIPVRAVTSSWPPSGWVFVACDVGQGDALLLRAGAGAAVEVDAGPDPVSIDRCMREFGIHRIPLLVLTHFHLDHVGGLVGALRGRPVSRIITGPLAEPATGAAIVREMAARHGLSVLTPPVGTHIDVGAAHLDVLGPPSAFHGTRSDPNNSSLVLMAEVDGVRILLPGDAEIEAQRWLVASGADLHADVLKVPHHGSAYSDPAFLAAAHASLAVVSVGAHNDYGHPSPILLNAMRRLGVPLFRTDRDGDVAVVSESGRLVAVVHGSAASKVASARDAWMSTCRLERSPPTTCRIRYPRSYCSSATKSCSSIERSARSPPRRGGATHRLPRPI